MISWKVTKLQAKSTQIPTDNISNRKAALLSESLFAGYRFPISVSTGCLCVVLFNCKFNTLPLIKCPTFPSHLPIYPNICKFNTLWWNAALTFTENLLSSEESPHLISLSADSKSHCGFQCLYYHKHTWLNTRLCLRITAGLTHNHSNSKSLIRPVFSYNEKMNQRYEDARPFFTEQEEWHIAGNLSEIFICSHWSWYVAKAPLSPWNVRVWSWHSSMKACQSDRSFKTNQVNGNKNGI